MSQLVTTRRHYVEVAVAGLAGWANLALWDLGETHPGVPVATFSFIYTFLLTLSLGIFGRSPTWLLGLATVLFIPFGLAIGMFQGEGNLNLWPIALIFYTFMSVLGFAGLSWEGD